MSEKKVSTVETTEKRIDVEGAGKALEGKSIQVFMAEIEAAKKLPPIGQEIGQKEQELGVSLPPEKRAKHLEASQDVEGQILLIKLKGDEEEYLVNHKVVLELEERYNSSETQPKTVLAQIGEYADKVGVEKNVPQEFAGKIFSNETKDLLSKSTEDRITKYLLNKETGRVNPAKHETLVKQTARYIELITLAQAEGDISPDISLEDVANMVNENIDKLVFQDRVAAENMLGDHGIRHLVGHNITVTEKVFDQLGEQGQQVKAMDRLMAHQIMIDHDIGYATSVVRDRINTEGIKGQDAGHNLLAAKFISDRMSDKNDHMNKVFGKDNLSQIHSGILYHDSSKLEFAIGDASPEARRKNLESAIHLADNTHAFEDKLPEVLYGVPKSLETMRLLKTAGEIGDKALVEELKKSLVEHIKATESFSEDDKEALTLAVSGLSAQAYKFSVPRICGNKPEFTIDAQGKVEITVEESAIHQEATALFGGESYQQLKKFIKDLGGPKDIPELGDTVETEKITFRLKKAEGATPEKTDYQKNIENLIKNEQFNALSIEDDRMNAEQKKLQSLLEEGVSPEMIATAASLLGRGEGDERSEKEIILGRVEELKDARKQALRAYANI